MSPAIAISPSSVAAGYGSALLPDMMVQNTILPEGVVPVYFAPPAPSREIGLAWRDGNARAEDFETVAG